LPKYGFEFKTDFGDPCPQMTQMTQMGLPIVAVDEPIYRRLPCFIIATVDKFHEVCCTPAPGGGQPSSQENANELYSMCITEAVRLSALDSDLSLIV